MFQQKPEASLHVLLYLENSVSSYFSIVHVLLICLNSDQMIQAICSDEN